MIREAHNPTHNIVHLRSPTQCFPSLALTRLSPMTVLHTGKAKKESFFSWIVIFDPTSQEGRMDIVYHTHKRAMFWLLLIFCVI